MIYEDEFYEKKKFTKKAQNTYLLSFFLFNGLNVFFFKHKSIKEHHIYFIQKM